MFVYLENERLYLQNECLYWKTNVCIWNTNVKVLLPSSGQSSSVSISTFRLGNAFVIQQSVRYSIDFAQHMREQRMQPVSSQIQQFDLNIIEMQRLFLF